MEEGWEGRKMEVNGGRKGRGGTEERENTLVGEGYVGQEREEEENLFPHAAPCSLKEIHL